MIFDLKWLVFKVFFKILCYKRRKIDVFKNHKDRRYIELNERIQKFIGKNRRIEKIKIR
jgi:hypothetical protein